MDETIMAGHPDPSKKGTRIGLEKYQAIHGAIRAVMENSGPIALTPLIDAVKERLDGAFDGSIPWYVTTVKLDMESRGELTCDRKRSPHLHHLT